MLLDMNGGNDRLKKLLKEGTEVDCFAGEAIDKGSLIYVVHTSASAGVEKIEDERIEAGYSPSVDKHLVGNSQPGGKGFLIFAKTNVCDNTTQGGVHGTIYIKVGYENGGELVYTNELSINKTFNRISDFKNSDFMFDPMSYMAYKPFVSKVGDTENYIISLRYRCKNANNDEDAYPSIIIQIYENNGVYAIRDVTSILHKNISGTSYLNAQLELLQLHRLTATKSLYITHEERYSGNTSSSSSSLSNAISNVNSQDACILASVVTAEGNSLTSTTPVVVGGKNFDGSYINPMGTINFWDVASYFRLVNKRVMQNGNIRFAYMYNGSTDKTAVNGSTTCAVYFFTVNPTTGQITYDTPISLGSFSNGYGQKYFYPKNDKMFIVKLEKAAGGNDTTSLALAYAVFDENGVSQKNQIQISSMSTARLYSNYLVYDEETNQGIFWYYISGTHVYHYVPFSVNASGLLEVGTETVIAGVMDLGGVMHLKNDCFLLSVCYSHDPNHPTDSNYDRWRNFICSVSNNVITQVTYIPDTLGLSLYQQQFRKDLGNNKIITYGAFGWGGGFVVIDTSEYTYAIYGDEQYGDYYYFFVSENKSIIFYRCNVHNSNGYTQKFAYRTINEEGVVSSETVLETSQAYVQSTSKSYYYKFVAIYPTENSSINCIEGTLNYTSSLTDLYKRTYKYIKTEEGYKHTGAETSLVAYADKAITQGLTDKVTLLNVE